MIRPNRLMASLGAAATFLVAACGTEPSNPQDGLEPGGGAPVAGVLRVVPDTVVVGPGSDMQFVAVDSGGDGMLRTAAAAWRASAGAIDSNGRYTAPHQAGAYRVTAADAREALAYAEVSVEADAASQIAAAVAATFWIEITPGSVTLPAGQTAQFTAAIKTSTGNTYGIRTVWQASGGSISPTGLYTAPSVAGTYRVIATREGDSMADTALVTVGSGATTPPTTPSTGESRPGFWVEVHPSAVTLAPSTPQQFTAVGKAVSGRTYGIRVNWRATGGSISSTGWYTAPSAAGTYRVIAQREGDSLVDTSLVTVAGSGGATPTLSRIELTPATATLPISGTQQFGVTGRMSDNSTTAVSVNYTATGGTISSTGLYTAGAIAGTFRVIATRQGDTRADTSVVTLTGSAAPPPTPPSGGDLGTPDPTLLPSLAVSGAVTTVNPNYSAFQALDPRSKPAGWTYQDPVTGVTVVKLTAAGTPVSGNAHNWYSDGGTLISHAWQSGGEWYVTVLVFSDGAGQSWLVDLKITGTPALTNWRQLTGNLAPQSDLAFSFSSVPGTARIAYVVSGGTLRRIDTQTMTEANTGYFPRSGVGSGPVWMHQDKNDTWFVSSSGTTARAFNAATGAWISQSWSGLNEVRIDREGGYAIFGGGGSNIRMWDLAANTVLTVANSAPFAHNASLRGRWIGTNWDLASPWGVWKVARSGTSLSTTAALYRNGFYGGQEIHWSGNWIQNVSDLDQQWAVGAGLAGVSGMWAKRAVGLVRADGANARLLGHHYNNWGSGDYWALPFVQISAGGHVVTVNTRLAYSDSNENNRTDILAFIMPRSGGR